MSRVLQWDEERIKAFLLEAAQPDWQIIKRHPSFSDSWVVLFLGRHRGISRREYQDLFEDQELKKHYAVRLALLESRHAPAHMAMNLVPSMRWGDLIKMLKRPGLASGLQHRAVQQIAGILPRLTLGERITIARHAPRALIRVMMDAHEEEVLVVLCDNPYFTHEDALFVACNPKSGEVALDVMSQSERWMVFNDIKRALVMHKQTPKYRILEILRGLSQHHLHGIVAAPTTPVFTRRIAQRLISDQGNDADEVQI